MPSNTDDFDSSRWTTGRVHISGDISTADEVTIFYIDCTPDVSSRRTAEGNAKDVKGTILLIHGFPETSYQWRHIITPLSTHGYRIITPDYRGAGYSSKPRGLEGYTKASMAADLVKLLDKLGVEGKVHVVGHDIGGMVAHSFASRYPEKTASVMWGECPQPGTEVYEQLRKTEPMWHFTFHWQPDLPEALVAGKERVYLSHFYDRLAHHPDAFTSSTLDFYTDAFSRAGSMRAGMDTYRAFHLDAADNSSFVKNNGKCPVPACAFSGAKSALREVGEKQVRELYEGSKVSVREVEDSGHWVAEENPEDCVAKIIDFVGSIKA